MANLATARNTIKDSIQSKIRAKTEPKSLLNTDHADTEDEILVSAGLSRLTISESTTIDSTNEIIYFGKVIEITNGATVTVDTAVSDDFLAFFKATTSDGALAGGVTSVISATGGAYLLMRLSGGSFTLVQLQGGAGGSADVADVVTGNKTFADADSGKTITFTGSSPANFTLPSGLDGANFAVAVKNRGTADITLSINASYSSYNSISVNTLTPGKTGFITGHTATLLEYEGEWTLVNPTVTMSDIFGSNLVEEWDFTTFASSTIIGAKGYANLLSTGYGTPTVNGDWLDFDGVDDLVKINVAQNRAAGCIIALAKIVGVAGGDELRFGFCDNTRKTYSAIANLDDIIPEVYVRKPIAPEFFPEIYAGSETFAANDIVMVTLYYDNIRSYMEVEKLSDTTYSPAAAVENTGAEATMPDLAFGGELRSNLNTGGTAGASNTFRQSKINSAFLISAEPTQTQKQQALEYFQGLGVS